MVMVVVIMLLRGVLMGDVGINADGGIVVVDDASGLWWWWCLSRNKQGLKPKCTPFLQLKEALEILMDDDGDVRSQNLPAPILKIHSSSFLSFCTRDFVAKHAFLAHVHTHSLTHSHTSILLP